MVEDLGLIQDIVTDSLDGYYENTYCNGTDLLLCKEQAALWQGFSGEIKTRPGECSGVEQENFGCRIFLIIGQPLTDLVMIQAEFYIHELTPKYEEIKDVKIQSARYMKTGQLKMSIFVESIFGPIKGDVIIG